MKEDFSFAKSFGCHFLMVRAAKACLVANERRFDILGLATSLHRRYKSENRVFFMENTVYLSRRIMPEFSEQMFIPSSEAKKNEGRERERVRIGEGRRG